MSFTQEQVDFLLQAVAQQIEISTQQTQISSQLTKAVQSLQRDNQVILKKLDSIESHVILIHGRVVSDFHGIEEDTKKAIECTAELVDLTDEEILEHKKLLKPTNKTREAVDYRKKVSEYSAGKELRSYGQTLSRGEAISVGNWVSGVVTKMFNTNFKGKYPIIMRPLVSQLVGYYAVERKSERMY